MGPEVLGVIKVDKLGDFLPVLVSLAMGLILFEGGLTLDLDGYRSASTLIVRLLTVGTLVTWLVAAACIWLVFGFELSFCLLAGSLIIVTGPTVIVPLLRRIRVIPKLHNILHWEAILIDFIGVFVAILCFEWVVDEQGSRALTNFFFGLVLGVRQAFWAAGVW